MCKKWSFWRKFPIKSKETDPGGEELAGQQSVKVSMDSGLWNDEENKDNSYKNSQNPIEKGDVSFPKPV